VIFEPGMLVRTKRRYGVTIKVTIDTTTGVVREDIPPTSIGIVVGRSESAGVEEQMYLLVDGLVAETFCDDWKEL